MQLQTKSPLAGPGIYPIVQRGKQLKYLSFQVLQLDRSLPTFSVESGDEELAIDFYSGAVMVEVSSPAGNLTVETRARKSLKEAGEMLYVPAGASVKFTLLGDEARISLSGALGKTDVAPILIGRGQVVTQQVGRDTWQRTVHTHIAQNVEASHLIVGETVNDPGSWSSCPPHKHDCYTPPEVPMEEVYFFQVEPKEGFGFMRVYTDPADPDPFDYSFTVQDGDTVIIPRGYHPVVAFPRYTLNYTWALAGEGRTYGAWSDDPKYAWIKEA